MGVSFFIAIVVPAVIDGDEDTRLNLGCHSEKPFVFIKTNGPETKRFHIRLF
jgi:hypothetical protein